MSPEQIADRTARFQIVGHSWRLRSRTKQRLDRGLVVSCVPVPTVHRTVEGCAKGGDAMLAVEFKLWMMPQNLPDHLCVPMPGRPLQRRHVVLAAGVDLPSPRPHQAHRVALGVLSGGGHLATVLFL